MTGSKSLDNYNDLDDKVFKLSGSPETPSGAEAWLPTIRSISKVSMVYVIRPLIFSFTLPFNSLEYFNSVMTFLVVMLIQFFESEAFTGGLPDVGHPLVMSPECEASLNFTYDDPLWLPPSSTATSASLKYGHRSPY